MSTNFQRSIAYLINEKQQTIGTGFVVLDDGLIVTCTHVINLAESGSFVRLIFYNPDLTGDKREVRTAKIVYEYLRDADIEDVTFLLLEGSLPSEVQPLRLGRSINTPGQTFLSFGFPEAKPTDGLLGKCEVVGFVSEDNIRLLQVSSPQISKGFSGAPIWDDRRKVVIGRATSIIGSRKARIAGTDLFQPVDSSGRQTETAFATPTETLWEISSTTSF